MSYLLPLWCSWTRSPTFNLVPIQNKTEEIRKTVLFVTILLIQKGISHELKPRTRLKESGLAFGSDMWHQHHRYMSQRPLNVREGDRRKGRPDPRVLLLICCDSRSSAVLDQWSHLIRMHCGPYFSRSVDLWSFHVKHKIILQAIVKRWGVDFDAVCVVELPTGTNSVRVLNGP